MKRPVSLVIAAAMLFALAACGGGEPPAASPSPTTSARISSTGKVTILEPVAGAVVQGGKVRVRIKLDGGVIVPEVSSNLKPNEGHIHLLLDGRVVQLLGSLDEMIDVAPGAHLLQVEFVAADHGPFSPRVIAAVSFEAA